MFFLLHIHLENRLASYMEHDDSAKWSWWETNNINNKLHSSLIFAVVCNSTENNIQ